MRVLSPRAHCQRVIADTIFVMGGKLDAMRSVVLYNWRSLVFSWFLWPRDLCFRWSTCLLHWESYGVCCDWGNNGSFRRSFHILLEWYCFCVWGGEWPALEGAAAHLAFPLIWQTTPMLNSHAALHHLPFPLFSCLPFAQASLPAHPGRPLSLARTPIRTSSHTRSLPEVREAVGPVVPT